MIESIPSRAGRVLAVVVIVAALAGAGAAAGFTLAGTLLDDFVEEIEREIDELDDIIDEIEPSDPTLADDIRDWYTLTRDILDRILALPAD